MQNSNFDGCGDNACNVHNINFKIIESNKDKMTVKFPNPQSYGFQCLRDGDIIAFIDPKTLLEVGRTKILHATLRDDYYYDLVLTTYDPPLKDGGFIECVSANPAFEFTANTINRVVGSGVLCTTRGKVKIEGNRFLNTGENGILIRDDVSDFFEGGPVENVTISGNAFINCEDSAMLVEPDNRRYVSAVHKNIFIENNLFVLNNIHALCLSSAENIVMKNNVYKGRALNGKWVVSQNTENFISDCPK